MPAPMQTLTLSTHYSIVRKTFAPRHAGDPAALAEALARLASSPDAMARFGRAGRKRVHTMFSVSRMVTRTEAVYLELAAAGALAAA